MSKPGRATIEICEVVIMSDFGINEMLEMQKALQEK
jgi:hypothetical protein